MLIEVLAPDTHRPYWKGFVDVRVEKIDISRDIEIESDLARRLMANGPRKVAGVEAVLT